MVEDGTVQIGAIHTYVELYARMFVDLSPDVVLVCASAADTDGNLYTGPNTEDTPTIAEAAAFHDGVVIVQADEIVDGSDDLPRVDIPGSWVDYVVAADRPFFLKPLFTRDPRHIGPVEILKAMIAIRGVYERHQVVSLARSVPSPYEWTAATLLTSTSMRAATRRRRCLDDLAQAVAHTVQWYDATRLMGELGATCAIETQPGHVLTRLLPSAAPAGRRDLPAGQRSCGCRPTGQPPSGYRG